MLNDARATLPPPSVGRFLTYVVRPSAWRVVAILLIGILVAAFDLGKPFALKLVVDLAASGRLSAASIAVPFALFLVFQGGGGMLAQGRKLLFIRLRERASARVIDSLFLAVTAQPVKFFAERISGSLGAKVTVAYRDTEQILHAALILIWTGALTFAGGQILLGRLSGALAIAVVVYVALMIVGTVVLSRNLQARAREHTAAIGSALGRLTDALANITAVKLFAREADERLGVHRAVADTEELGLKLGRNVERVNFVQSVLVTVLVTGLWGASYWLYRSRQISVGDFVLITSVGIRLSDWAERLGHLLVDFLTQLGSLSDSLATLVPADGEDRDGSGVALAVTRGAIAFRDVHFHYVAGRPLFRALDLEIPAGQRVALVGRSGAGKSSFVNLLLRFYRPQRGRIEIDGHDLAGVNIESLRAAFSVIPQDAGLFHRSIGDNIRYGDPSAAQEAVIRAAVAAHADEFIRELEHGYDALVGERGGRLSGGQRQRIAIARAFLKDAPIVILDEATTSLDSITEANVTSALDRLFAGRTVLFITHRLASARHFDRILVFHDGDVVEDGSHAELVQRGGRYSALWNQQPTVASEIEP